MDFKGLSDPVVVFNKPEKRSIFDKLHPPGTNFFKGKKYLAGALTVFLLFAVGLGVYLSQRPTQLIPHADTLPYKGNIRTDPPGTCTLGTSGLCTVKVIWDVSNIYHQGIITEIKVRETGTPFTQRGQYIRGEQSAPWITAGGYNFDLYVDDKLYDSIFVKGISTSSSPSPVTSPTASPSTSPSPSPLGSPEPSVQAASPSPSASPSASPSPSPLGSPEPSVQAASPSPSPGSQAKGDGNHDGKIDLQDLSIMFSKWSPALEITSGFELDFNDDKKINSFDHSSMQQLLITLGLIRSG